MRYLLPLIFLFGIVASNNSSLENNSGVLSAASSYELDHENQAISWGEWSPCSRSCGGGISKQQKRCRRKLCKGRPWNIKYKVCNVEPCNKPFDFRAEQCSSFDSIPYSDQLLKWYPYYDPSRPCALICRGEQIDNVEKTNSSNKNEEAKLKTDKIPETASNRMDDAIVVQLADKVQDGTPCYHDSQNVCINGECKTVGCDLKIGSNKNKDICGICGGDGSTCIGKYTWTLESTSACSESCGGGFQIATAVCKSVGMEENVVDSSKCDIELKPDKVLLPCNTQPCSTKWLTGEWGKCSVSCGGGSRNRAVFCIDENGNATRKLPDDKCSTTFKPKYLEICNAFSCPMWETGLWSECSVSCGTGVTTRSVECRDGNGRLSNSCNPVQRPRTQKECRATQNNDCSGYFDDLPKSLMQSYPEVSISEKLVDQPVPSQSTFIAGEWSACSVTCGEGTRHREVACKILLEFSRIVANLKDDQCLGPKPIETEKCVMQPCNLMENSLVYRIDAVGDSSFAESGLTDSFRSSMSSVGGSGVAGSATSGAANYESHVKVASGSSVKTTYSWKEVGYTDCSATCLGGIQDLIITCVRDDTGKSVMPLLCSADTKPESRIRVCNDHPCPPRWNTSEFSPCMSPCGLGIQTREVTCIHEVTRGTGNTVAVPNHMCPQPPPVDRQYCNVWDCPVEWHVGEWGKCSKTCGGGVKKRKVSCEQVMAQGRKQSRQDRDCPTSKPRSEKECNSRPCEQLAAGAHPIIASKNSTYNQEDPNKKVNLDIGGRATIFQGTPVIKIRCPVKKFDKADIIWKKDREALRKSRKYKINKKGALKIVDINFSDSGVYSCWAGQTNAQTYLTVKPKQRDLLNNEEVLRAGNAVHQRQGAHFNSASVNSEPYYGINSEESEESRQEGQRTTERPRRKKQKQSGSNSESGSTGKYDYSITPLHQPVEATAASSASALVPHFSRIINTIKNYWPFQDSSNEESSLTSGGARSRHKETRMPSLTTDRQTVTPEEIFSEASVDLDSTRVEYDFFRGVNTAIPDNTFGPDEERIFIDDDPFDGDATVFSIEESPRHRLASSSVPTVTMTNYGAQQHQPTRARHHHGEGATPRQSRNQRGASGDDRAEVTSAEDAATPPAAHPEERSKAPEGASTAVPDDGQSEEPEATTSEAERTPPDESTPAATADGEEAAPTTPPIEAREEERPSTGSLGGADEKGTSSSAGASDNGTTVGEGNKNTPVVLGSEDKNHEPTIGPVAVFSKAKDDLVFEWVTTDWSRCSQTCGGGGFQMRGAQCTVRSAKTDANTTKIAPRTVIGASLCEDAGYPVPEKVRACGSGRCPQWYTSDWSPCETSRCFNWKTAMQRREISCRLVEETEDKIGNSTTTDPSKCDEAERPPQRQECYNDACKGVWRVGEWSECSASCEEDGIKYRILQCVWYGTKKPAGNACRDIPRPPVMKTCRGPSCLKSPDDCKDHSQLCGRVKLMGMCRVPLYGKQCCKTCHQERHL